MFLKEERSGDLVRIDDLSDLMNPFKNAVTGRDQAGEEEQDAVTFAKDKLVFPSGEKLPRCWIDPNYQNSQSAAR